MTINNLKNRSYGLYFDGNNDYVDLGKIYDIGNKDFTLEFLVSHTGEKLGFLITNKQSIGSNRLNVGIQPDGRIHIFSRVDSSFGYNTPYKSNKNEFFLLSISRISNKCYFYVNGELVDIGSTYSGDIGRNSHWSLGGRFGTSEYFYNGIISEVRIWNRALTEEEIKDRINKKLTGEEEGLVAYYPMAEGEGNILYDYSGNANHGTIHGATWIDINNKWNWNSDSYLIKDENNTLTFDLINQEWIVLDLNQENFKNKGITSLDNLIQNTTKIINVKTKLNSGQVFKEPVNFKAYKVIYNINVI